MPGSLIQRYTYGNFATYPALPPETDFFGLPTRHGELVQVAKAQIAVQQQAAAAIVRSNVESADLICRELREQTRQLESTLRAGTDEVVAAIGELGNRVVGELVEIRWELIQLKATAEQILEVLRRPRSTEAAELVRQGVRNLINDKIDQAEERFLAALKLDNTDYQVLMNLSAVALRKDDAERAIAYVKDALTLPASLDAGSKAEALWSLSRVRYTLEDYGSAAAMAELSIDLRSEPRRMLQHGVYCMLAGRQQEGLDLIEEAIKQEPGLFALVACMPDLAAHQEAVLPLLASLAGQALRELHRQLEALERQVAALSDLKSTAARDLTPALLAAHERLQRLVAAPSYSACCRAIAKAQVLRRGAERLATIDLTAHQLADAERSEQEAVKELETARLAEKRFSRVSRMAGWIAAVAGLASLLALGGAMDFSLRAMARGSMPGDTILTPIIILTTFIAPVVIGFIVNSRISKRQALREGAVKSAQHQDYESKDRLAAARLKHKDAQEAFRRSLAAAA